ncbi:lanthionine synthetase c-like protein domain-containing protein [Phthorimaea operculella]|nr:lanthionine synthetase c-like protein domain-containing protein [Phthorimaea operculella]
MSSSKGSFENQYEDFSPDGVHLVINDKKDGISGMFQAKLESFKEAKLNIMETKLKNDIFYDGTVYTGSAGYALYHLMSHPNKEKPLDHLLTALQYINLDKLKGRRISFVCGDAGPLAIATVISYQLGSKRPDNLPDYKTISQKLISLISLLNESPNEIMYGKAGYLYALLFVNKHIGKELIPAKHIQKVIAAIIQDGKDFAFQVKSDSPLLWQWHEKIYFGAAHGMAGILYMILQARAYTTVSELRSLVKPAVDWLLGHRFPSGNFPSSLGSASGDRLVQWCHGAPGFTALCLEAHQVFEEEKYMKIALQCGEVVWQRGLCAKGYSLCHGVAGNAYTFLQLYQATKKPMHLYRACCFADWCVSEREGSERHRPDRPASLFEGLVGRLYFLEDLQRPMQACFPGQCL